MTCVEYRKRMSRYMDGELSRWSRWKVENHMQECAECASLVRDLQDVDLCILAAVQAESSPEFVTEAIIHRLPPIPPARHRPSGMVPWIAGVAVIGMQAAVLFGAYWSGFTQGSANRASLLPGANSPIRFNAGRAAESAGGVWSRPLTEANPATLASLEQEKRRKEPVSHAFRAPVSGTRPIPLLNGAR